MNTKFILFNLREAQEELSSTIKDLELTMSMQSLNYRSR